MTNNFKIPVLFILLFLISKEVFSYDSEKVVILCILSFIFIVYFNFKDALYETLVAKSTKLKDEYNELLSLKHKLELEIKNFIKVYKNSQNQIFNMRELIMNNFILFLKKANKNRKLIIFHIIKDQLNLLVKDQLKIKQNLNIFLIKNSINNLRLAFQNKTNFHLNTINSMPIYFNKLISLLTTSNFIYLIINKMNINKEFNLKENKGWTAINNYLYLNLITKF